MIQHFFASADQYYEAFYGCLQASVEILERHQMEKAVADFIYFQFHDLIFWIFFESTGWLLREYCAGTGSNEVTSKSPDFNHFSVPHFEVFLGRLATVGQDCNVKGNVGSGGRSHFLIVSVSSMFTQPLTSTHLQMPQFSFLSLCGLFLCTF